MQKSSLPKRKRRAMTTEAARRVKFAGHAAEREFAELVGGQIYPGSRKRDVVDPFGNIHSVKSGKLKWQIFLYSRARFEMSVGFLGAKFFIDCIDAFPNTWAIYQRSKRSSKLRLKPRMRALKQFLTEISSPVFLHANKLIFLQEALFHSSEVDFLSIKENSTFHIFDASEVQQVIDVAVTVANSKARRKGETDDQKVLFKLHDKDLTIGEIEIRTDSKVHYRRVKFWMSRTKTLELLREKIGAQKNKSPHIITYGKAGSRLKLKTS